MLRYVDSSNPVRYTNGSRGGGGMADALVSEASDASHEGSTPSLRMEFYSPIKTGSGY